MSARMHVPGSSGRPAEAVCGTPLEVGAGGAGRYRLEGLSSGGLASLCDEVLVAGRAGHLWVTHVVARSPHVTCRINLSESPRVGLGSASHRGVLAALVAQALFTEGAHVQRRGHSSLVALLPFYAEADAGEDLIGEVATAWVADILKVVALASSGYPPARDGKLRSVQVLTHPGREIGPVGGPGLAAQAGA